MAKLFFRYGAMGSSKSAHLLMTGFNFREKGIKTVYIKPSTDNRDGDKIASRIGLKADSINIGYDDPIHPQLGELDMKVILVDEVQFFSERQINELADIADANDILIICYGLRADARGQLFEGSRRLFEIADSIEELKATCNCGKKAVMNARLNEKGEMYIPKNQVEIGGNDKYIALCRKCWMEKYRLATKAQDQTSIAF